MASDARGVPATLATAPDFVQVRLGLMRHLGGALEAVVFTRIQYRTQDDSRAWVEHDGRRWWTVTIADLAAEMGATDKQIRRVLELLTERGALLREHLSERGPYDRRWSYSPVILDVPSGANEVPSRANVEVPWRANVHSPSRADLPTYQEDEEGEKALRSPFCSKHLPNGPGRPCMACGDARMALAAANAAERSKPTATPPRLAALKANDCPDHPGYPLINSICDKCEQIRHEEVEAA